MKLVYLVKPLYVIFFTKKIKNRVIFVKMTVYMIIYICFKLKNVLNDKLSSIQKNNKDIT
jgi:hypothetical protein